MATATCVVALSAVAAGLLVKGITQDASVEPAGQLRTNPSAASSVQPLAGPGRPGDLPPGTYRYTLTRHELLAHGLDEPAAAGVWTWTLGNGRWSYRLQNLPKAPPLDRRNGMFIGSHCAGYYDVVGSHIKFTTVTVYPHGQCAPPTWFGSWSRARDGLRISNDITLGVGGPGDPIYQAEGAFQLGGKRWQRISGTT